MLVKLEETSSTKEAVTNRSDCTFYYLAVICKTAFTILVSNCAVLYFLKCVCLSVFLI